MSQKLPILKAKEFLSILKRYGFAVRRQSGSHIVLAHDDGRWVTVPFHKGKDLPKGLLRAMMKTAGLSIEDLKK